MLVSGQSSCLTSSVNVITVAGTGATTPINSGSATTVNFGLPSLMNFHPVTGDLFWTGYFENLIRQMTPQGIVTVYAGTGTAGVSNGFRTSATFNTPGGLCFNANGTLMHVTDQTGGTLRKINMSTGQVTTFASALSAPTGCGVDSVGNVFVAELNANLIRRVTPAGVASIFVSGFNGPTGLVLDPSDNIYLTDQTNHLIKRITPAGTVSVYAGSGAAANSDGPSSSAGIYRPYGITRDILGNLYVTGESWVTVRKINVDRSVVTFAGSGASTPFRDGPNTMATFNQPYGVAVDSNMKVFVGDANNYRIRKIVACTGYSTFSTTLTDCVCTSTGLPQGNGTCCPLGQEPSSDQSTCITCPTREYRSASMSSCDFCPLGSEVNSNQSSCNTCTYGRIRSSSMTSCTDCPVGFEAAANKSVCVACSSGYYRPSLDSLKCIQCPLSTTCNETAITACPGGFKINSMAGGCDQCPIGTQPSGDFLSCVSCTAGINYRSSLTQSTCQACPTNAACTIIGFTCNSGYEISTDGISCNQCAQGYAKTSAGNTACAQCSTGQESNSGRTSCVSCTAGTNYRSSLTQSTCQVCPSNAVCTVTGFTCSAGYEPTLDGLGCSPCLDGYVKSAAGNAACSQCAIGTESAANRQSCTNCPTGKYRPLTTFNKCVPCPSNGVCTATNLTCNAGYKLNIAGDGCDQCPVGQQSNAGFTACVACTAGTNYRSSLTQTGCVACPTNAACTATGFTCNPGYEPTVDGIGCSQCQDGFSKTAAGNTACTQCALGTESASNKQSCVACSAGKYRSSLTFNKCIPCPPYGVCTTSTFTKCLNGYKKNAAGDGCDQCPIGQDSTDGLTCVGCQAGNFKPSQDFATCIACPYGSSCGGSSISCQSGYYFDTNSQCKRNDTFFALMQTATNTVSTVTNYVTVTQTSTSTSTTSIYATATQISVQYTTQFATIGGSPISTVTVSNSQGLVQTVTVSTGTGGTGSPQQQAQSANSVTIDFIGTLPISPLILAAITFGAGLFIMLIFSLICCRRRPPLRRKDEEFDGMTSTATGMNTQSQRTFTNNSTTR